MAPRSKLTPETAAAIVDRLAAGATLETAAAAVGVSERTLQRWFARARELRERREGGGRVHTRDRVYVELVDDVETAQARGEVEALEALDAAIRDGSVRAITWKLENVYGYGTRRRPGRPVGATSAPDRPSTAGGEPPRLRLRQVG